MPVAAQHFVVPAGQLVKTTWWHGIECQVSTHVPNLHHLQHKSALARGKCQLSCAILEAALCPILWGDMTEAPVCRIQQGQFRSSREPPAAQHLLGSHPTFQAVLLLQTDPPTRQFRPYNPLGLSHQAARLWHNPTKGLKFQVPQSTVASIALCFLGCGHGYQKHREVRTTRTSAV